MAIADNFKKYLTTTRFTDHRDLKVSYDFYENDYSRFLPRDKDAPILDVGCGIGEFIGYLRKEGYLNVVGIDASSEVVDFCKKNSIGDIELVNDAVGYLLKHVNAYSLITLNDTIEHFPKESIVNILIAIKSSLKKGGLLLIRTGNCSTVGGIYLRYKDFTHETAYTESSLAQVLRMAGFDDIEIFGNRYPINFSIRSILRAISLRCWFFILSVIYLTELGRDRPNIYSKLLIAVCRN